MLQWTTTESVQWGTSKSDEQSCERRFFKKLCKRTNFRASFVPLPVSAPVPHSTTRSQKSLVMRSSQLLNMSRLYSKVPSIRLASGTKSTLPAMLSCRARFLFSTSPIPRTSFLVQRQKFQFNTYSTDYGNSNNPASHEYVSIIYLYYTSLIFLLCEFRTQFPPSKVLYFGNIPFEATADDIQAALVNFEGLRKITFGTVVKNTHSRSYKCIET
jgi:hypothetical protein